MTDRVPGPAVTLDPVTSPAHLTPARLGLGRVGAGLPTRAALAFAVDHAQARDAVQAGLDLVPLATALARLGQEVVTLASAAPDRATYLRRPDFGRRLSRNARSVLAARVRAPCDVAVVIGDGLSAKAVQANAEATLAALLPLLRGQGLRLGPVVLATQARVALGDEIGALLGARLVLVLIGERPGLSAADSLGAYVTLDPRLGRTDAERNCVSNIRDAGLVPPRAAATLAWLIGQAFVRGLTGVALKDDSAAAAALPGPAPVPMPSSEDDPAGRTTP